MVFWNQEYLALYRRGLPQLRIVAQNGVLESRIFGPIVYRLGHGLFKAVSAVRLRVGSQKTQTSRLCEIV